MSPSSLPLLTRKTIQHIHASSTPPASEPHSVPTALAYGIDADHVDTGTLYVVRNQQLQLYFFIWKIKRKKADPTTLGRWVKKRVKVNADMGD